MSDLLDARTMAWIAAWNCLEAAQQTRVKAMQTQDRRARENDESDMSHYFSQMSQQYTGLMEEARIYTDLASVPEQMVGLTAGNVLHDVEQRRVREEAMRAEFMDRTKKRAEERAKTEGGQNDSAPST